MAEQLSLRRYNNNASYLQQFDWRVEIQGWSRAARCYLRICILLREGIFSLEQPGDSHSQQGSIFVVANYLNQQEHFVCGLFDPPYLEANIIMFAEFAKNLGQLVVSLSAKIHVANLLIPGSHLQLGEPGPQVKKRGQNFPTQLTRPRPQVLLA